MSEQCYECGREAEMNVFPHYAAYNASSADRNQKPICCSCAASLIQAKRAERVSPFSIVRVK